MSKSSSIEDFNLLSSFETVKQMLLNDRFSDRLKKPLGYWVLPNDRRLPLAFLQRSLDDLLSTPFDELSATPGIGQKKISSLVTLLQRATKDEPPGVPVVLQEISGPAELSDKPAPRETFDPSIVSEALWTEWCQMVREFNIGNERLGRLSPSLKKMPTVIWNCPLSDYLEQTVTNIRRLRTHGEKRVRCVLEVFHAVYQKLLTLSPTDDIQAALTPQRIAIAQKWVAKEIASPHIPTDVQIRNEFALPMLEQLRIDSGDTVYRLAEQRLGINGPPQSVRDQSRSLGVTRARVYQLLDDCSKVMQVRWPEGKTHLDSLTTKFAGAAHEGQHLSLFYGLRELCYPEKLKSGPPMMTPTSMNSVSVPNDSPIGSVPAEATSQTIGQPTEAAPQTASQPVEAPAGPAMPQPVVSQQVVSQGTNGQSIRVDSPDTPPTGGPHQPQPDDNRAQGPHFAI